MNLADNQRHIKRISELEFNQLEATRKIIVNEHSHVFGIIDLGEPLGNYGLCWGSDIITPCVELSNDRRTLWVGVDQRLAAIDLQKGHICIAMSLMMPLFQIAIADNFTAVLTELEVLLFSPNRTLTCFSVLPDLTSKISVSGSDFTIERFDGSSLFLTRSGVIKQPSVASK